MKAERTAGRTRLLTAVTVCWSVFSAVRGLPASPPQGPNLPNPGPPTKLVATCWGAAGRVSGSLHVLDTGNGRWMIDCGAVFPDGEGDAAQREAERLSARLPIDAAAVDTLLLTHAHADHCGRVPLLVNSGFRGPIIATQATSLLLDPMLGSTVRHDRLQPRTWVWSERSLAGAQKSGRRLTVHWQACRYAGSIAESNLATQICSANELDERLRQFEPGVSPALCRACIKAEVDGILRRVYPIAYKEPVRLAPGVRAGLLDAGHIPGSASVVMEVELQGKRVRVLYSGDLGSDLSPVLAGPRPAPNADAVFIEATYGAT
ncbi:MAG: MBL fold metallo-hydrolase, partial [Thermoguttaceae bacterium]|nr:MBL fold metallo-hydrolase [Thermoguttaceae bacterium]